MAILLCHAPASVSLPNWLSVILSRCAVGVDMFFFLSGVGLYYSLRKYSRLSFSWIVGWYRRRFRRLFIPFVLIYVPFRIVIGIIENESFLRLLGEITTLSFWTHHSSAWFIAVLVPLYVISPFLYFLFIGFKSGVKRLLVVSIIIALCLILGGLNHVELTDTCTVFSNIQFALARIPTFIFGLYMGTYVANGFKVRHPFKITIFILALALLLKLLLPSISLTVFGSIPILMLLCAFFEWNKIQLFNTVSVFLGTISLESYLFNGVLPYFFVNSIFSRCNSNLFYNNYLSYSLVIIIGTFLSYLIHKVINRIDTNHSKE